MKNEIVKTLKRSIVATALALCAFAPLHASAQSWSIPNPYLTNTITWLPQPQTAVPVQTAFVPAHAIKVINYNLAPTNNCTNIFFTSLDGTNKIPYLIASVNGVTGNYGNIYVPTGTNATDTIVFAATNLPVYGASEVLFGTNSTGVTNPGAQTIITLY